MCSVIADMLASWVVDNQQSASTLPESTLLSAFMSEWASTLTAIYTIAELIQKTEYTQFYEEFCVFEDKEEVEENSFNSQDDEDNNNSRNEVLQ